MITAELARALSKPDINDYLSFLDLKIQAAANKGENSVIITDYPYRSWAANPTSPDSIAGKVIRTVRDNGFTVSVHYSPIHLSEPVGWRIAW